MDLFAADFFFTLLFMELASPLYRHCNATVKLSVTVQDFCFLVWKTYVRDDDVLVMKLH